MAEKIIPHLRAPTMMVLRNTAPLLNMPYHEQLKKKEERAKNALYMYVAAMKNRKLPQTDDFYASVQANDGLPCVVEPIRYNAEKHYRNKSTCSVGFNAMGEITVGHSLRYKNVSKEINRMLCAPIDQLPTNKPCHTQIFNCYEEFLRNQTKIKPRGDHKPWGTLLIRSNEKEEIMVHVNFNPEEACPEEISEAKDELIHQFLPKLRTSVDLRSLYWMLGKRQGDDESKCPSEKLWGDSHLEETLLGKRFLISPRSFFQVNTNAARILYSATAEQLRTDRRTVLLDVCCGTGTIGIIMSDYVSKVIGVDICSSAIKDAKVNSQINNTGNIEHFCADAEVFLSQLVEQGTLNDFEHVVAVVNPHRTGLTTKMMLKLREVLPLKQVVYLSCRPEGRPTFNFMRLSTTSSSRRLGSPFLLNRVIPIDPFPFTKYVELVLNFER